MKFGMTPHDYEFIRTTVLNPIRNQGGKVWVFGSRARGDYHPYSDLDILISLPTLPAELLQTIQDELSESKLPFKVDLVLEANLAKSYHTSVMRERIEMT